MGVCFTERGWGNLDTITPVITYRQRDSNARASVHTDLFVNNLSWITGRVCVRVGLCLKSIMLDWTWKKKMKKGTFDLPSLVSFFPPTKISFIIMCVYRLLNKASFKRCQTSFHHCLDINRLVLNFHGYESGDYNRKHATLLWWAKDGTGIHGKKQFDRYLYVWFLETKISISVSGCVSFLHMLMISMFMLPTQM